MKRQTIAAAAILAALAAYIYWFERDPVEEAEGEPVFAVEEEAVDRIEVRFEDREPVIVEREGEGWRVRAPVETEADPSEVDLLVQNLASMRYERAVARASEVDLASFGLDVPGLEVRFRTEGGEEGAIQFGSDTPTAGKQYARREGGEDVLVVPSHLSINFDRDSWDLREKSIFDIEGESELRRVEIERPSGKLVLDQDELGWMVTEPLRSRADRVVASSLATRLRTAEMKQVVSEVPEELGSYGLDEPKYGVSLVLDGEEPETLALEVGEKRELDFYARAPSRDPVFLLDGALVGELDREVEELLSKRLFEYSTFDVNRFRIDPRSGEARVYEKVDVEGEKRWRRTSPEPAVDVETTTVEGFLYALNGATAADVVQDRALGEHDVTITVWSKEPEVEEGLLVASSGDDGVLVRRAGEDVALELSPESWADIESKMALEPQKPD